MLKQCATTAITAVRAASTMLAMDAMLGRLAVQLKMPRLDAYPRLAVARVEEDEVACQLRQRTLP